MTVIPPTIGRIVLFFPAIDGGRHEDGQPFGSMIAGVNDDGTINLLVAARDGSPYGAQNVLLVQDGDEIDQDKAHATWMAYQKGQAAKAEQLQSVAATSAPSAELAAVHTKLEELASAVATPPTVDLTAVHQKVEAVETNVQSKFEQLGDWLKGVMGEFHDRVTALEPKKEQPAPAPVPPPATPPAPAQAAT